ncbi:MAG: T9SS type A sorting domain-containing protein [Chitinophagales bacterium]|nr:T9SS type A sorting domain-containing protein [Chitinophagales bacterium]
MKVSLLSRITAPILFVLLFSSTADAQHSVAREWNETLLHSIRNDFARPTVHARNLWHTSIAMYDCWAAYESSANTFFLGDTLGNYVCSFNGVNPPANKKAAQEEAISYAMYRLLKYRFDGSPGGSETLEYIDSIFLMLGYDSSFHSTNYADTPAALGNYIAENIISFGLTDGANEQNDYANTYYNPQNPTLIPDEPGNPNINNPNYWQPLTLEFFVDQSGNHWPINTPEFLSPEWGDVVPFSLTESNRTQYSRNGDNYWVYEDPGSPPLIDINNSMGTNDAYKWGFSLVSTWSSHLDPADTTVWDISPASIGNVQSLPTEIDSYPSFYNYLDGGDPSLGHSINPVTGLPYVPQNVLRADYARVLAEFWADGPDSETPPGHWFTILNYVNDHPLMEKKWRGKGTVLDTLEWDVKAYFALSGAVHDAAIVSWSLKGYYDYIRPISAIRYMADQGQCTDTSLSNYNSMGIPLVPNYIEVITTSDPLSLRGNFNQHLGKIKLYAWRGPDHIGNPDTDSAGVGWIRAEKWWPYQRPTFVTPPFAGFVSGHSTFSRAAAEVMTLLTGDEYFPGGMGEFIAPKNEFLVFEDGPSETITLQWATYRDASDQCSLSRIWGGIHPPADDIPGRLIGKSLGPKAFIYAETFMDVNGAPSIISIQANLDTITDQNVGSASFTVTVVYDQEMDTNSAPDFSFPVEDPLSSSTLAVNLENCEWLSNTSYIARFNVKDKSLNLYDIDVMISGGEDLTFNREQNEFIGVDLFSINMGGPIEITFTDKIGEKRARLNWSSVTAACSYMIRGRLSGSSSYIYLTIPGGWTSYSASGLVAGSSYEWQIAPNCPSNGLDTTGNWTVIEHFTTLNCIKPSPTNTSNITATTATLNWTEVADAIGYIVYGRKVGDNIVRLEVPGGSIVSYNATGLTSNSSYEWAVEAVCGLSPYTPSGVTGTNMFTTLSPSSKMISNGLRFYPNPMTGGSVLEFPNPDGDNYELKIFDLNGRMIYDQSGIRGNKVLLQRSDFTSGAYIFKLISSKDQMNGSFVVD